MQEDKPKTREAKFTREGAVEIVTRAAEDGKAEEKVVRLSVSSEEPYLKWCWDEDAGDFVRAWEVLGHGDGEIDFTRIKSGLVIQDGHFGEQIGIMDNPEVKDGKLCGEVRFGHSQTAQDIKADALDGIRRNMSVGYMVGEYKKDGEKDGYPIFRAVKWTPFEGSFVNVPADPTVGVGRSLETNGDGEKTPDATNEGNPDMDENAVKAVVDAAVKSATDAANVKIDAITAQVKELSERKPEMPSPSAARQFDDADTKTVAKKYNMMNAIRALAGDRGVDVGFEKEVSDEIAKMSGRSAKGLFIPDVVLSGRAFDVGANGAQLVATDTLFGELVPALVAKTVLGTAGVRTLAGLSGNIKIPVGDAAEASWGASEGANAKETTPVIGDLEASPKGLAAYTDITRELTLQSGISAQAFVTDALLNAMARKLEAAAFAGTGADGQPKGIDATTGVNEIADATTPDLAKVLEFITAPEVANADVSGGKFIGRPNVWALLGSTFDKVTFDNTGKKASSAVVGGVAAPRYILDTATNKCQGYDFIKSNLAKAKTLYFGDWSKMLFCLWSGVDITVDPYSLSLSGKLRIVAHQNCDIVVTQPKAFAKGVVIA